MLLARSYPLYVCDFHVYTSIAKDEEMFLVPFIVCCCCYCIVVVVDVVVIFNFRNILFLLHQPRTPLHIHANREGGRKSEIKVVVYSSLYA